MSWGAVAGAVISTGASLLFGGDDDGDAAVRAGEENARLVGDIGRDQWEWYQEQYRPLEQALIADAMQAGSAAEYERRSEQAAADVNQTFGLARERRARDQASYGLNPEDGRFQAGLDSLDLRQAAAGAGAQNRSRAEVRDEAWKRRLAVTALGQRTIGDAMNGLSSSASQLNRSGQDAIRRGDDTASGIGSIIGDITSGLFKTKPGNNYGTIDPTTAGPGLPF